jgi:hypothetical protein
MADMSRHSNQGLCSGGSNQNIGQRFEIDFFEPSGNVQWTFTINMDSGYGYQAFVDSTKVGEMLQDVWSGGTNPKSYSQTGVSTGSHTFTVYGAEGCCDGEAGAWSFQREATGASLPLTKVNLCAITKGIQINYFSTSLSSNKGSPLANQAAIDAAGSSPASGSYCSHGLTDISRHSNQGLCSGGSNQNIGQRFRVSFYEPVGSVTWNFKIYMDSGYGYVVFVDGAQVGIMTGDVWSGDTNPKTYTTPTLSAGLHTFTVYGGEGCCDGEAGAWQFQRGSGTWRTVAFDQLAAVGNGAS